MLGTAGTEGRPEKLAFFSTFESAPRGPRVEAESEARDWPSPLDSSSSEPSGVNMGSARPSRKWPAGRKKHDFTLLYGGTDMLPKEKMKQVERKKMGEKE